MDGLLLRPHLVRGRSGFGVRGGVGVRVSFSEHTWLGVGLGLEVGLVVGLGLGLGVRVRFSEHTVTKLLPTMASGIDMKSTPATMAAAAITWPASVEGVLSP